MKQELEAKIIFLGNEPKELLGFNTEKELEKALEPLMAIANVNSSKDI